MISSLFVSALLSVAVGVKPAQVRVINAVSDSQLLTIQVGDTYWQGVPYGQRTGYADVEGNRAAAHVSNLNGERLSNDVVVALQPGYPHTVVFTGFVEQTGIFSPIVLRDTTAARPRTASAQVSFVNALTDKSSIKFLVNGALPDTLKAIPYGSQSAQVGLNTNTYDFSIELENGKRLFSTRFQVQGGTRYTAVAMGSSSAQGNRAPRLFFYTF
jgi:hypothetical protein